MIHRLYYSLAAISIHFKNLGSDHLLNSLGEALVDVGPSWLIYLWWFWRIVLSGLESTAPRHIWHLVCAHHHHCWCSLRGLLFENLLRRLNLQDFSFNLSLDIPLLRVVHVFNDLCLSHLFLVCLLLPPNICLARVRLIVLLLRLMIKLTDLLAQCSLRIVP